MKGLFTGAMDAGKTMVVALVGACFVGALVYYLVFMGKSQEVGAQVPGSQIDAHYSALKKEMTAWHNETLAKMIKRQAPADSLGPFVQQSLPILLPDAYKDFRIVSMENPVLQQLPRDTYVIETDVVLEKGGAYDWRRYKTVVQKHKIVSLRLGTVDYLSRARGDARNVEAEQTVKEAIQGVAAADRSRFGVYLRGQQGAQKGIGQIQVQAVDFVSGSGREQLYQVKYTMNVFGQKRTQEALVFARLYEDRKWQIEDIAALGETL